MFLDKETMSIIGRFGFRNVEFAGAKKVIDKRVNAKVTHKDPVVKKELQAMKDEQKKLLKDTLWVEDLMYLRSDKPVRKFICQVCKRRSDTLVRVTKDSKLSCYICLASELKENYKPTKEGADKLKADEAAAKAKEEAAKPDAKDTAEIDKDGKVVAPKDSKKSKKDSKK